MKLIRWSLILAVLMTISACSPFPFSATEENYEAIKTETTVQANEISTLESTATTQSDYGQSARGYLDVLSGEIGDRVSGTGNETSAADYIKNVFENIGYTPEIQWFTGYDDYEGASFESSNIIAVKKGLSDQEIIIGAHYDSVDDEGSQGADDNASGVAVMLETAKRVFTVSTPYTLVFVAFGGEEEGLWGSANFVKDLKRSELKNIIGMINLDSLIAGDKTYIYGNEGPGSMRDWMLADAKKQGLKVEGKTDEEMFNEDGTACECSDFDAFEKSNIPYAYFEATDWDLSTDGMTQVDPQFGSDGEIRHTEYDTLEYIDQTFPGRIEDHLGVFSRILFDFATQY